MAVSLNHKKRTMMSSRGYRLIYMPEHERADKHGYVFEHIVVWEEEHNEKLPDGYVIHHINHNKTDNRPSNLQKLSIPEHVKLHHSGAKRGDGTRQKLSEQAKERFAKPENHPNYKNIDAVAMLACRQKGMTVNAICEMFGICKYTFYKKIKEASR